MRFLNTNPLRGDSPFFRTPGEKSGLTARPALKSSSARTLLPHPFFSENRSVRRYLPLVFAPGALLVSGPGLAAALPDDRGPPLFSRHVAAVFSRLGCNGGTCHGAV